MGLKELFKSLKRLEKDRESYYIEPKIYFEVDDRDYLFFFLPTIIWQPWIYRYSGVCVLEIVWMHFHICFGKWREKK